MLLSTKIRNTLHYQRTVHITVEGKCFKKYVSYVNVEKHSKMNFKKILKCF